MKINVPQFLKENSSLEIIQYGVSHMKCVMREMYQGRKVMVAYCICVINHILGKSLGKVMGGKVMGIENNTPWWNTAIE